MAKPLHRWIEHDPYEILKSVNTCIERATEQFVEQGYCLEDIKAIGITNQRETTVCHPPRIRCLPRAVYAVSSPVSTTQPRSIYTHPFPPCFLFPRIHTSASWRQITTGNMSPHSPANPC